MVQRACIFVTDKNELLSLLKNDPYVLEIIARFRPCFFLASENESALASLNYNSAVHVHNSWPTSLTFNGAPLGESIHKTADSTDTLFVESKVSVTWIMNIDCWFLLPEQYEKKLLYLAPHVYCFNNTAVVKTI